MIVGDRSRSLGLLVNSSANVAIIWKPNFHFASDHKRSQRLITIETIAIAEIESETISAISAIVNDPQRSQQFNGNHQCNDCSDRNDHSDLREIIWKSQHNDRKDCSDHVCSPILTIPAIIWKSVLSDRDDCSDRMLSVITTIQVIVTIVNDHMETRLYNVTGHT